MAMCEDYPACGHTDGLGCDWTSPNDEPNLYFCPNEHGFEGVAMWHQVGTRCFEDNYDDEDSPYGDYYAEGNDDDD